MADDNTPDDDFQEMLRRLLGAGGAGFDAAELERLTGMSIDPAMLQNAMRHLQGAMNGDGGIDWSATERQALHQANQDGKSVTDAQRDTLENALALSSLWLSEATTISDLPRPPRALTRGEWVSATLPVWQELAEPVATSIADALTAAMRDQAPEEMQSLLQGAGKMMRTIGGSLFATQLGHVIGRLSTEVISGGDVGIPVLPTGEAAVLPQNFADFGRDLEIGEDQLALYIGVRELAHARLFKHAKWLRLHVLSQVTEFARGVHVDMSALEDLAGRFDPSNPDELRSALESGALLPQHTETQQQALARLETLLAVIEGWVDVVTADATARLPRAAAIAEAVRRRRAAGGPAEDAFAALVGLQLRPRRLREAAAMWRTVTDAVGIEARDALWDYPDFMPGAADIDDPQALVERLRARAGGEQAPVDEIDDAIARILAGETPDAEPDEDAAGEPDGDGDTSPEGPRPV